MLKPMNTLAGDTDVLALARRALLRARSPVSTLPERLIIVDVEHQLAHVLENGRVTWSALVSTSVKGIGGEQGSEKTPPGWHRVRANVGDGAEAGTVFKSREPTGEIWRGESRADDLILTRVITLDGLEDGINRGPGCDSVERYIYFHGTNQESLLGTASSIGCIRLSNAEIVQLFDRVREGDLVVIVAPGGNDMPRPLSDLRFHYAGVGVS